MVADVDMISDMLAYQQSFFGMSQSGDNSSFVFNAVDFLAGSPDLIAIRSRGQFSRPFDVVDEIELAAEKATEKEVAAIQEKIKNYQQELQSIGANGGADTKNAAIIKSTAIKKRREIEEEIRQANRELRTLQARRREKVEALASRLRLQNLILAPAFILAIAVALAIFRYTQAKRYAARRAQ